MALADVFADLKNKEQSKARSAVKANMPELKQKGRHFSLCALGEWHVSNNPMTGKKAYSRVFLSAYKFGWEFAYLNASGNITYNGFVQCIRHVFDSIDKSSGSLPIESTMDAVRRIVEALRERTGIADLPMPESKDDLERVGRIIDDRAGTHFGLVWPPKVCQTLFAKERAGEAISDDDDDIDEGEE